MASGRVKLTLEDAFQVMDQSSGRKIVYIMTDKNCEKYAHKLQTLISAKHDVKCSIYMKDIYRDNMSRLSSDNIIIFIGENEISRAALPNVENKAGDDYGLFYGWHGKRAKISTHRKLAGVKKHKDFIEYYNELCTNFEAQARLYGIRGLVWDAAVLASFGLVGITVKKIMELPINKNLQYNACIMEFFRSGLDQFMAGC